MSVSDGQPVNASVSNGAYVSRLVDTNTIGILALENTGSGGNITNTQQQINDNTGNIATNTANIATNTSDITSLDGRVTTLEGSVPNNRFSETTDPDENNDDLDGVTIGTQWINTVLDRIWQCVDNSTGAAIWKRIDKMQLTVAKNIFFDFGSTSVDDSAWVELDADIGADEVVNIFVQHQAGIPLRLATGAAASETEVLKIIPGGYDAGIPIQVPANSRLSIRAEDTTGGTDTINSGFLILNLMKEV